jgi:very-short-patch-repair endonuclease
MSEESAPARGTGQIAQFAARQHGVVAAWQLHAIGLSDDQVALRAEVGWLHQLHRGVYAVGHRRLTEHGRWSAAVLACGPGAVLSHHSAAALWRLRPARDDAVVDVTIPTRAGRRRRRGIAVHRPRSFVAGETMVHEDIPVTAPARTLLDLAAVLPRRAVERAIDEAARLRLCNHDDLARIVFEGPARAGRRRLRAVLGSHSIGSTLTRSELEERFLALCRRRALPHPEVNVPLLDYTVDFHWPDAGLVVELDGQASHGTRAAFHRDRDRDSHLAAHGFRTLRFTWWDVVARPAVVAHRVVRVLGR